MSKGRLQSFCKSCQSEYAKEYRKANSKELVDRVRNWRKVNKSNRELSHLQKSAEEIRQRVRKLLNKDSDTVDELLGYSANQLKKYLIDKFGKLPDSQNHLKFIKPLVVFEIEDTENWKEAASFSNISIIKKS